MTCCLQDVENKYDQNMKSNKVLEGDYFEFVITDFSRLNWLLSVWCLSERQITNIFISIME